jgi:Fe-S-cluster containining protein
MNTLMELGRITLPLVQGTVEVPVKLPKPQASLLDLLPSAWEAANLATADSIHEQVSQGKAISCRPHCGACCRQLVSISIPEAVRIADYVAEQEPARQQILRNRFATIVRKLEETGLLDKNDPPTGRPLVPPPGIPHEQAGDALALAYFQLQLPCPFLEDESCSIYEIRPSICREYHVTSPAELCQRVYETPIDRVVPKFRTGVALMETAERVAGAVKGHVPLTLSLEWAETVRESMKQQRDSQTLADALVQSAVIQSERIQRGESLSPQVSNMSETTTAKIELALGDDRLRLSVTVDNGPTSPRALLPLALALSDVTQKHDVSTSTKKGNPVSCKQGCAACCRQLVPLAEPEARQIAFLVNQLPEPRQSQIRQRFADAKTKLEAAGLYDNLSDRQPWPDGSRYRDAEAYFNQQIACPFLENESCSIHSDRPLSCREHLVTSPAEHCQKPFGDEVKPLPLTLSSPFRGYARGAAGLGTESPVPWVPLTLALNWAEANPEPAPSSSGPAVLKSILEHMSGSKRS